jgi:hypothetical protein
MSGMNTTRTSILDIIKACGEYGVSSFEHKGLTLKFYNNKHNNQNLNMAYSQDVNVRVDEGDDMLPESAFDGDELIATDNQALQEEMLAQLAIDDPAAYEELQLKRLNEEGSQI